MRSVPLQRGAHPVAVPREGVGVSRAQGRPAREPDRAEPEAEGRDEPHSPPTRPPSGRSGPPPRRSRPPGGRWGGLLFAVLLLALAGAAGWTWWQLTPPDPTRTDTVAFEVRPGWGGARVARELEEAGLIRNATVFSVYLRLAGVDRTLGEGLYDLGPQLSAARVAERLAAGGRPRIATVVIPEGYRARDVAARLEEGGVAPADEVMELVDRPGELAPPWLPEGASLEGYLFPDTYQIRLQARADAALELMVDQFAERVGPDLRERLADAGLGVHEWAILASMVQAEAAGPSEMGIIAGVFLNRLDRDMLLQSDPTVAYGLGKDLPQLSALDGDLRADHPWNTYTRPGLPRGPIGNPGIDALRAVLEPERQAPDGEPWLYFLHGVDGGEPVFRPNTTLAAHERDIDAYLR